MGIEDIQISEELETNAPSIKYRGDEGPKSPQQEQQMMMAQLEQEYSRYVFEMEEQGIQPMTLRQFIEQAMAEGQMSSAQPMAPQAMPPRQMAAFGGIMGLDGRRKYGIGSKLKSFVRKVIPNEISEIAVKAAPFVAPFNPIAAGLMAGVGGFDQTGRIGSSLKSGLMTYGMGQLSRGIGGGRGNLQANPFRSGATMGQRFSGFGDASTFGKGFLSNPMQASGGLGEILADRANQTSGVTEAISDGMGGNFEVSGGSLKGTGGKNLNSLDRLLDRAEIINRNPISKLGSKIMEYVPTSLGDLNPMSEGFGKKALGAFVISKGVQKLSNMAPQEVESAIIERGENLDIDGIRTEVLEAYRDSSGKKLKALAIKYPYIHQNADVVNVAQGGRIRRAEGGIMDLGGMEKDYRAEGGFVPIGREEKADDVPARLSVNEFVFTADAVRNAGGGDIDKGAEVMENMMKNLEQGGQVSEESQGIQSLRAGGRAGFANGLSVDTDQVKKDLGMLKYLTPGGMLGSLAKTGAKKISDIELETLIKVIAKATPGGMVAEKVTEVLIDRYGMSPEEAQMKIVNKLGMDANEGFKNPSGTSDDGYNILGIESSAEDYYPEKNRLSKFREQIQDLPRVPTPMPNPGERMPDKYYPEGPGSFPERGERMPMPYPFPDRDPGIFMDRDPDNRRRLQELFNTSQRLSEVSR